MDQYGLFHDKTQCIKISEQNHYKKEEDSLYYLCNDGGVNNCEKCSSKNECNKCKENYIKINNDKSICHELSSIEEDKYIIDPNDNNNYIQCSNYIQNCNKCDSNGCKTCENGFILLNDNRKTCYEKSKVNLTLYYTENNEIYYSCSETKNKNNINCFSIIPKQNIEITFAQIQKINKKLYCYMMTHSPFPKDVKLKIKIDIYKNKKIRNLEGPEEREFEFSNNVDSDGSTNKIIPFISREELNDGEGVEEDAIVKDMQFDNGSSNTQTLTENNVCSIKFNKNSDLIDTGKVRTLIKDKKVPDCSRTTKSNIINLNTDKIEGCEFSLESETPFSYSNGNLELELISKDDNENKITAQCDTKKNNIKIVNCQINDEADDNYSFKDEIIYDSNNFISVDNKNEFKILCSKKTNKTILIVAITVCAGASVAIVVVIIVIICKNVSQKNAVRNMITKSMEIEKIGVDTHKKMKMKNNEQRQETGEFLTIKAMKKKNKRNKEQDINNNSKRKLKKDE